MRASSRPPDVFRVERQYVWLTGLAVVTGLLGATGNVNIGRPRSLNSLVQSQPGRMESRMGLVRTFDNIRRDIDRSDQSPVAPARLAHCLAKSDMVLDARLPR